MSAEEFSGLDLAIETVRGVRSFDVDALGRLTGVSYHDVWLPGENVATCHRGSDPFASALRKISASVLAPSFFEYYYGIPGYGAPRASGGVVTIPTAPAPSLKRGWLTGRTPDDPAPIKVEIEPTPEPEPEPEPTPEPPHNMGDCGCGFYGYYDGSNDYKSGARVSAVIEGYGETVIGTRGFRAQKARILALCIREPKPGKPYKAGKHLTPAAASRVRRNYPDVPSYTSFADMVADFPIDRSWEPSPATDPDFWTRKATR